MASSVGLNVFLHACSDLLTRFLFVSQVASLKSFKDQNHLQRTTLLSLAFSSTNAELDQFAAQFQAVDTDNSTSRCVVHPPFRVVLCAPLSKWRQTS